MLGRVPNCSTGEPFGLLNEDFIRAGCVACGLTNNIEAQKGYMLLVPYQNLIRFIDGIFCYDECLVSK